MHCLFLLVLAAIAVNAQQCQAGNRPQLWYFNIQGKAESIRMILADNKVDYEFVPVSKENGEWVQIPGKPKIPELFPFGQVPFYMDDNIKVAQSMTIARYLGKKFGLYGRTQEEAAIIDQMADGTEDLAKRLTPIFYAKGDEQVEKLTAFRETDGPRWVGVWNKLLEGKNYLTGDFVSYADYILLAVLELVPLVDDTLIPKNPNVAGFMERMKARPNIAQYYQNRPPAYYKKLELPTK